MEEQRNGQGRERGAAAARIEIGGHALFVVVLQEMQHPRLQAALELPFLREAGRGALAPDDAAQGIVEARFVVEQVETGIGITPVVVLAVDFGDEQQARVLRAQGPERPGEEFGGHEFHHIAAETVHALVGPEAQHLQHLAPGGAVFIIEFDGVVPVVFRRPGVEHVVAGGLGGVLFVSAFHRGGQVQRFVEQVEILGGEIAVVLAVHVVGHEVDDHLHAGVVRTLDQGLEFGHPVVEVRGQCGIDVEPVADGVGRAGLALDDGGIAVGDRAEVRPRGVRDDARVPHRADRELLEFQEHLVGDVAELAGPVFGIRASGNARPVPEGSQEQLIDDHASSSPSSGSCRSRSLPGWEHTAGRLRSRAG